MSDPAAERLRWAEALESGKFEQAEGALKDSAGHFCCLGVACELYDPSKWKVDEELYVEYEGMLGIPPPPVLERFGITEDQANYLATLNDSQGKTFKEIAQVIREGIPSC